jgi:hypothetical protein
MTPRTKTRLVVKMGIEFLRSNTIERPNTVFTPSSCLVGLLQSDFLEKIDVLLLLVDNRHFVLRYDGSR